MNISDKQIHTVLKNYTRQIQEPKAKEETDKSNPRSSVRSDEVILSEKAQEARLIREIVRSAPEIREERVQKLKRLIKEGKYHVDSREVAEKAIDRITRK